MSCYVQSEKEVPGAEGKGGKGKTQLVRKSETEFDERYDVRKTYVPCNRMTGAPGWKKRAGRKTKKRKYQ